MQTTGWAPEGWTCRDKDRGPRVENFGRMRHDKEVKVRRSKIFAFCRDIKRNVSSENSIFERGAIRLARFLRGGCHATAPSRFSTSFQGAGWNTTRIDLGEGLELIERVVWVIDGIWPIESFAISTENINCQSSRWFQTKGDCSCLRSGKLEKRIRRWLIVISISFVFLLVSFFLPSKHVKIGNW